MLKFPCKISRFKKATLTSSHCFCVTVHTCKCTCRLTLNIFPKSGENVVFLSLKMFVKSVQILLPSKIHQEIPTKSADFYWPCLSKTGPENSCEFYPNLAVISMNLPLKILQNWTFIHDLSEALVLYCFTAPLSSLISQQNFCALQQSFCLLVFFSLFFFFCLFLSKCGGCQLKSVVYHV